MLYPAFISRLVCRFYNWWTPIKDRAEMRKNQKSILKVISSEINFCAKRGRRHYRYAVNCLFPLSEIEYQYLNSRLSRKGYSVSLIDEKGEPITEQTKPNGYFIKITW